MSQSRLIDETEMASESRSAAQWSGPLFVVGMFRSGTSLLYTLLNKHPQVALMYEGDLFRLQPFLWTLGAGRRWTRCDFWNGVFHRHGLDPPEVTSGNSGLLAAIERVYREYACRKGALIWGDKSPNYYDFLGRLAQDFPDARFIIIWRDPLAICRSAMHAAQEARWFSKAGMNHRILMGCRVLKRECDRLVDKGAGIYQLQYEELVRDPAHAMKGICTFLGIPFVSSMVSLEGADRSAIYDGGHHSLVRGQRVIADADRAEILPNKLKRKIERYINMWQRENHGAWPISAGCRNWEQREPSTAERIFDQLLYRSLRGFDFVVNLIHFWVPRRALEAWRRLKQGLPEASPSRGNTPLSLNPNEPKR